MNNETINTIESLFNNISEHLSSREDCLFKMNELKIDNGIFLNQMPVEGHALKNILKTLGLRKEFMDFSDKMSEKDWNDVSSKIKGVVGNTMMYAKMVNDTEGNGPRIINIFKHNGSKNKTDAASYTEYVKWVQEALAKTKHEFKLRDFSWDEMTEDLSISLVNENSGIDIFNNDIDVWKTGQNFTFNSFKFDYAPFFERLVCSNGNIAREYGFKSNISQNRFNNKRILGVIERNIVKPKDDMNIIIQNSAKHLRENNVSIGEFQYFKNLISAKNDGVKYNKLLDTFFNESPFYTAYGDINNKSAKWKSTADSGINAYDFFNMLTYIASHPDDVKMDNSDRIDLQIKASNLLFKKELDLEDVATKANIIYPKIAAMN